MSTCELRGGAHDGYLIPPYLTIQSGAGGVCEIGALVVISFISVMDFQVSEGHLISIIPFVGSMYALSPVPPIVDVDEPRVCINIRYRQRGMMTPHYISAGIAETWRNETSDQRTWSVSRRFPRTTTLLVSHLQYMYNSTMP
jgi:hypothetical protein